MSLEFELKVKCDFCKKDITEGESVFCEACHSYELKENEEYQKEIERLKEELKDALQELKVIKEVKHAR